MKDATKSFCMPLDIDGVCHHDIRDDDGDDDGENHHRNVRLGSICGSGGGGGGSYHQSPSPPQLPIAIPPPIASIYYVPSYEQEDGTMDSGEAKFLLTSTCTFCYKRRNRIPRLPHNNDLYIIRQSKPMSLRRLNDHLYCNLILDLQSTLKYRSGWFLLFWLPFCMCAALSSVVLLFRHRNDREDGGDDDDDDDHDSIIRDYKSSWRTISIIVIVSFVIGKILYRIKLRNIEDELHIRVQHEWLPLLEQNGFAINYVIDDPGQFYSRKETYIHIYRINPNDRTTIVTSTSGGIRQSNDDSFISGSCVNLRRSNSLISQVVPANGMEVTTVREPVTLNQQSLSAVGLDNEAKYLVFYPMELARRNVDARQIGYSYLSSSSSESTCQGKNKYYCSVGCDDENEVGPELDDQASACYYVKPPTLRDLPNSEEGFLLLHEFLYDIEIMTSPSYTIRMLLFVLLFILFILICVYAMAQHDTYSNTNTSAETEYYPDNLDGSFALFCFLLLIYICDRILRLYTNLYGKYYDVANVVEKVWLPQFQLYGYTVTYRVDQPHWYSFREDYIHIYKSR